MPNAQTAYYTTNHNPKVISDNLDEVRYDEENMVLYVKFNHNGVCAKYMGVTKEYYDGMMAAPSAGTFFYHNIRQSFPFKYITEIKSFKKGEDILSDISLAHRKLNELDAAEKKAQAQLKKGIIDQDKFDTTLEVINGLRKRAGDALDREMGVYVSPAAKRREEKLREKELQQNLAIQLAILEQKKEIKVYNLKKIGMGVLIAATVVFTFSHILVGLIVLGILIPKFKEIR